MLEGIDFNQVTVWIVLGIAFVISMQPALRWLSDTLLPKSASSPPAVSPTGTTAPTTSGAHHHHHHHPHFHPAPISSHAIRVFLIVFTSSIIVLTLLDVPTAAAEMGAVIYNSPPGSFTKPSKMLELAQEIHDNANDNLLAVTAAFCFLALLLQTFCIPGTIMLNVMFGALLGLPVALPLCVVLGGVGGCLCFGMSSIAGTRLAEIVDEKLAGGRGIDKLRRQVEKFRADLLSYLLFLRLTPFLPNWLVNLASPVVGVPFRQFATATFLGIIPQTYLACRFGSIAHRHMHRASSAAATEGGNATSGDVHAAPMAIVEWHDTVLIALIGFMVVAINRLRKRFHHKDDGVTAAGPSSSSVAPTAMGSVNLD